MSTHDVPVPVNHPDKRVDPPLDTSTLSTGRDDKDVHRLFINGVLIYDVRH